MTFTYIFVNKTNGKTNEKSLFADHQTPFVKNLAKYKTSEIIDFFNRVIKLNNWNKKDEIVAFTYGAVDSFSLKEADSFSLKEADSFSYKICGPRFVYKNGSLTSFDDNCLDKSFNKPCKDYYFVYNEKIHKWNEKILSELDEPTGVLNFYSYKPDKMISFFKAVIEFNDWKKSDVLTAIPDLKDLPSFQFADGEITVVQNYEAE